MSQELETVFQLAVDEADMPSHTVTIKHGVIQMNKEQDFTAAGKGIDAETNEPFDWAFEADGHGTDTIINIVREKFALISADFANPVLFINKKESLKVLQEELCQHKLYRESSGCTAILTKIYKNRITIDSVGDSFVFVTKNDAIIWRNTLHKWDNEAERARLHKLDSGIHAQPSSSSRVLSTDSMCQVPAHYVVFPPYSKQLALTQALGHDNVTGLEPQTVTIEIESGQEYRVVAFSDGVGDILIHNDDAELQTVLKMDWADILRFAEERWRQEWHPVYLQRPDVKYPKMKWTKKSDYDDVSTFVVAIVPN
uniref:PPM-type phosphatase domain-containing protein n=1 Tax=viral metagenome TaxID=1070528 RepID=A0A6C0D216_9ZZZZ